MKKLYRIIILLVSLIFLTTYSPNKFSVIPEKKKLFFKIQNIKIINNHLIDESKITEKLNEIYVNHTGQNIKKIEEYLDRDSFMGPEEAKNFGLIDKIVNKREDIEDITNKN